MFAFFVMFTAAYIILAVLLRLAATYTSGTPFGAALAYIHS